MILVCVTRYYLEHKPIALHHMHSVDDRILQGTYEQVKRHEEQHKLDDPHGHAPPPSSTGVSSNLAVPSHAPLVGGEIVESSAIKPGQVVLQPIESLDDDPEV